MAPNPRVAKAFRAMRDIGIPEEKTKPVLKNLLRIFEKNWELIEEENYRALADAIFESEEMEAAEEKKKLDNAEEEQKKKLEQAERLKAIEEETQIQEEPERPLKRLRLRHQEVQASPSCNNSSSNSSATLLIRPKLEVDEIPEVQPPVQSQVKIAAATDVTRKDPEAGSPQPLGRNKGKQPVLPDALVQPERSETHPNVTNGTESDSDIASKRRRDKGKEPLSPQSAPREKRSISGRPSSAVCLKEPKVEPGTDAATKQRTLALVKPKDEPITDDTPRVEVPLAVIRPESLTNGDTITENNLISEPDYPQLLTSRSARNKDSSNCVRALANEASGRELAIIPDESTTKLDIASSSSGEIKIYLSCNSALVKPNVTTVDALLKTMEDKCLKSYKVLDSNFSVKKMMEEMCECLLDVGSDSTVEPHGAINVPPPTESSKTYCNGAEANGSVNIQSGDEPQIPKLPSLFNGVEDTELQSLVVNNESTHDERTYLHDVIDIAKGQERVVISMVNEVNSKCLPSFHYIPRNAVFQNAYVNFSLARIGDDNCCSNCFGDCLTLSTPCACALQSGGEFAYTTEGLVKEELIDECIKMNRDPQKQCLFHCKECPLERAKSEEILEPCQGHSVRSFIKECWLKCRCNKQCGNRVVQRGIKHKLQVFMTPEGKGWGLRTLEDLPKGAFVCEYVGEVLTIAELYDRVSGRSEEDGHSYPVLLDADWGAESEVKDEEALCLDSTYYGNVARFINHRCFDSNLIEIPVEVETPDHHYYHFAFFTTRKVKALEELTWDYGIDFDDENFPVKAFQCQCGSQLCRNVKRSNKSRRRKTLN